MRSRAFSQFEFSFCYLRPEANFWEKVVTVCPGPIAICQETVAPNGSIPMTSHSKEGEKTLDIQLMAFKVNS